VAWLEEQADRLDLLRLRIRQALSEARLAAGEHAQLVPELEEMADGHPLDERIHEQLMLALYRSGRQADALAVYHRLRATLDEELGGKTACYRGSITGSIPGMKVSVSLPDEDVEFLDSYAQAQGISTRSAVLHKAVGLLRATQLGEAYEEAWRSWEGSEDAFAWESADADGLGS
jgi:Arc/MetJ-type ribon-helix-helix transcriptional regulator